MKLFSNLEYEDQLAIFDIVKFVNYYNLHQLESEFSGQSAIQKAMKLYTELSSELSDFEEECNQRKKGGYNIFQNINTQDIKEYFEDFSDFFCELDDTNQKNIKNFLCFLLYSKLQRLNAHSLFQSFNNLTEKISVIVETSNL